jgi:hypothetical protein
MRKKWPSVSSHVSSCCVVEDQAQKSESSGLESRHLQQHNKAAVLSKCQNCRKHLFV